MCAINVSWNGNCCIPVIRWQAGKGCHSLFACLGLTFTDTKYSLLPLLVLGTGARGGGGGGGGLGTGLWIAHLKHSDPQKYERPTTIATTIAEHLGVGDLASAKQSEYTAAALLKISIVVWNTVTNSTQRTNCWTLSGWSKRQPNSLGESPAPPTHLHSSWAPTNSHIFLLLIS